MKKLYNLIANIILCIIYRDSIICTINFLLLFPNSVYMVKYLIFIYRYMRNGKHNIIYGVFGRAPSSKNGEGKVVDPGKGRHVLLYTWSFLHKLSFLCFVYSRCYHLYMLVSYNSIILFNFLNHITYLYKNTYLVKFL